MFHLCNVSSLTRAPIIVASSFVSSSLRTNNPLQRMKQSDTHHIARQLPWSLPHRLHPRARHGQGNRHGVQQAGAEEHDWSVCCFCVEVDVFFLLKCIVFFCFPSYWLLQLFLTHFSRSFVEFFYIDLNYRQAVYFEVNEFAACLSLSIEFYFFLYNHFFGAPHRGSTKPARFSGFVF